MKGIPRSPTNRNEGFYRYLKPGALAQLRDLKINARSHGHNWLLTRYPLYRIGSQLPQNSTESQTQISTIGYLPHFFSRTSGPYCAGRKRLMAAKSVPLVNVRRSSPVVEPNAGDDTRSLINVISNDVLLAG